MDKAIDYNLKTLENVYFWRKKFKRRLFGLLIWYAILLVVLLYYLLFFDTTTLPESFFSLIAFLYIAGTLLSLPFLENASWMESKNRKDLLIYKAFERLLTDLSFDPEGGFPFARLQSANLLCDIDCFKSRMFFSGLYQDVFTEKCQLATEKFKGHMFAFTMHYTFKEDFCFQEKNFNGKSQKIISGFGKEYFKPTMTFNEALNKRFDCYAENLVDPQVYLPKELIKQLCDLCEALPGKTQVVFKNSTIYISIKTPWERFENSIFGALDIEAESDVVYALYLKIAQFAYAACHTDALFLPESSYENEINETTQENE